MFLHLHLIALAGFAGLMILAAFEDFRRLVIPNPLILGLCAIWPFHLATAPTLSLANGVGAVGCAALVFLAGALLFSRGLVGGGDVKLFAVATLWAGPGDTLSLLIATALLGGLLTLVLLSPVGPLIIAGQRPALGPAAAARANSIPVPYGVAIAAGALIVTIPPTFSW